MSIKQSNSFGPKEIRKDPFKVLDSPVEAGNCPICGGLIYRSTSDSNITVTCSNCDWWRNIYLTDDDVVRVNRETDYYKSLGIFNSKHLEIIIDGLEKGYDVSVYAKPEFNASQMIEIYLGLGRNVDVTLYANPNFTAEQMQGLRTALEYGIDIDVFLNNTPPARELWDIINKLIEEKAGDTVIFLKDEKLDEYYNPAIDLCPLRELPLDTIMQKYREIVNNSIHKRKYLISIKLKDRDSLDEAKAYGASIAYTCNLGDIMSPLGYVIEADGFRVYFYCDNNSGPFPQRLSAFKSEAITEDDYTSEDFKSACEKLLEEAGIANYSISGEFLDNVIEITADSKELVSLVKLKDSDNCYVAVPRTDAGVPVAKKLITIIYVVGFTNVQ